MTWLLCPHCLSWVTPRGTCCPQCVGQIEAAEPDPTPDALAERIGGAVGCVGEVRVTRYGASQKKLPDRGLLIPTDRGLFFLPHRPEVVVEPAEPATLGVAAAWWAAGLTVGPLALALPAARLLGLGGGWPGTAERRLVYEPRPVEPGDAAVLAEHLMADPGAFFLSREAIRVIRRTGPWPARGWTVECDGRPAVRFAALSDPRGVRAGLRDLSAADLWHGAIVG